MWSEKNLNDDGIWWDEKRWGRDLDIYDFFGYVFVASDHLLLVQILVVSVWEFALLYFGAIAFMGDGGSIGDEAILLLLSSFKDELI